MTLTSRCFVCVIACACAAWQPSPVRAQDEDVQLWVYAIAEGELDPNTAIAIDFSARWREQARGDEQQTLRVTLDRTVDNGIKLGGGFGVFEAGGETELRPFQQLTLSTGRFSARTRIEQRWFDGADRMELRFRQQVRYAQPLGNGWRASIDGEYLGLVQTRNRAPDAALDQWRGRALLTRKVSEQFSLGAGYLLIFTPQPGRADQINHVPQVYLTRSF
jgi:hypothetical protein